MSSRSLILVLIAFLLFNSCTDFLHGNKSENDMVKIQTEGMNCLEKAPDALMGFFEDKVTEPEIHAAFTCVSDALGTFAKYTRGESADRYKGAELQHFFNRYLLKKYQISDELIREVLKLKAFVVGGNPDFLTRTEIEKFQKFLLAVRTEIKPLIGSMRLLLFKAGSDVSTADIENVRLKLQKATDQLIQSLDVLGVNYDFPDFQQFIAQLDNFLGNSNSSLKSFLRWIPLGTAIKNLFVGQNLQYLKIKDWTETKSWLVDTFFLALRYYYHLKTSDFDTVEKWNIFLVWADQIIRQIEISPALVQKQLEIEALDQVVEKVWELKIFTTVVPVDMAKSLVRRVIARFVADPQKALEPEEVRGIDLQEFRVIQKEYAIWRLAQDSIQHGFSGFERGATSLNELQERMKQFDYLTSVRKLRNQAVNIEQLKESWVDWNRFIYSDAPLVMSPQFKVLFNSHLAISETSFVGLNTLNALRSLIRFVVYGYGTVAGGKGDISNTALSEGKLVKVEHDFKDFGLLVKFLDPRSKGAAKRTFAEANFFTFHANGDEKLNYVEFVELMHFMISGGRNIVNELFDDLVVESCDIKGPKDVFDRPFMRNDCYKRVFLKNFDKYFANAPELVKFVQTLPPERLDQFYKDLYSVSLLADKTDYQQIEYAEARVMPTIAQYVEAFFVVYDKDHNGFISKSEAMDAFPRFKAFLLKVIPFESTWLKNVLVEDVYLYLLYKGKKPGPSDAFDLIRFKMNKGSLGQLDRLNFLRTLAVLKAELPQ